MKAIIILGPLALLASCGPLQDSGLSGQTGYFKPATRFDPESKFGLFISKEDPLEEIPAGK